MEEKDKSISQLSITSEIDGSEVVPFAKEGGNGSLLISMLKEHIRSGLATTAELTELNNLITRNYAKKSDIPDIDTLPTKENYNTLLTEFETMRTEFQKLKNIVSDYPTIPLHDGKCYVIQNGQWVVAAGLNEEILVAAADL